MQRTLPLLLAAALLLVSCGEDNPTANQTAHGSMSATIDNANWSPTQLTPTQAGGTLILMGTGTTGSTTQAVSITVPAQTGTYSLGGTSSGTGTVITYTEASLSGGKTYASISGSITVEELSATGAKGTFNATVEHNQAGQNDGTRHTIANGSFNVTF